MLNLSRPLIWLDVETHDKGSPDKLHIIELGFKVLYPPQADGSFKDPRRWNGFIKPPVPITAGATEVHNITNEMVADAPPWKEVAANVAKGFRDCDFGGYNVFFDLRVISGEMQRAGVEWDYDEAFVVDGLRIWQVAKPRTLGDAMREFCGKEPTNAHRALEDAEDAESVTYGMLGAFPNMPRTPEELHKLCFPKNPNNVTPDGKIVWAGDHAALSFGKHAGVHLKDIPPNYLRWMLGGDFSPHVKRVLDNILSRGLFPVKEVTDGMGSTDE